MSGHEQSVMESSTDAEGASEWDDSYDETENSEEVRNEEEQYEKTLRECQERFGDQLFAYMTSSGQKVGTITDIITECSAVKMYILQGPDAVAGFVSGHKVSKEEADKLLNGEEVNTPPDHELITPPAITEKAEDEPKPTPMKAEKATDTKKAEETKVSEEPAAMAEQVVDQNTMSVAPLTVESVTTGDKAPTQVDHQVGSDNSDESKIETQETKSTEQQGQESVSVDRDAGKVASEKIADKLTEEIIPEIAVVQEEKKEAPRPSVLTPVENIQPLEITTKPVEKNIQTEETAAEQSIEQIDIEEVAREVFHVPHVETVQDTIEPIAEIGISDEIITETASETVIIDNPEEYLLSMDTAVEEIERVEESVDAGSELTDSIELNVGATDDTDAESVTDSVSESETELSSVSLQSALEHEQADNEPESEAEKTQTVRDGAIAAIAMELVGEAPDAQDEIEYDPEIIQNYVAAVAEHIEVLESSKNEQECRDAIIGLRKELANLLSALGYQDVDSHVERIIRNNHNMSELKRIIESLLRAAIVDESISDTVKTIVRPHHKFGQWVVGRTTMILRAA